MHTPQIISQVLVSNPNLKVNVSNNDSKSSTTFNSVFKKEVSQQAQLNTSKSNGLSRQENAKPNQTKVTESKESPQPAIRELNADSGSGQVQARVSDEHSATEEPEETLPDQAGLLAFVQQFIQIDRDTSLSPPPTSSVDDAMAAQTRISDSPKNLYLSNQEIVSESESPENKSSGITEVLRFMATAQVDSSAGDDQVELQSIDGKVNVRALAQYDNEQTDSVETSASENLKDIKAPLPQIGAETETAPTTSSPILQGEESHASRKFVSPTRTQIDENHQINLPTPSLQPRTKIESTVNEAHQNLTARGPSEKEFELTSKPIEAAEISEIKSDSEPKTQNIPDSDPALTSNENNLREALAVTKQLDLRTNQDLDTESSNNEQDSTEIDATKLSRERHSTENPMANNGLQLSHKDLSSSTFEKDRAVSNAQFVQTLSTVENNSAVPPVTTGNVQVEQAKSVAATDHISPRVGTKAWDQAISQKVVWMVAGGEQSAELSLNPPDLGPIQVVLSISDNHVDASFVSSHLDVREAIEAAAPKLREMMDSAGISLSGFSVSSQGSSNSGTFSNEHAQNSARTNLISNAEGKEDAISVKTMQNTKNRLGAVDTFA